jgi:hypothetical protein
MSRVTEAGETHVDMTSLGIDFFAISLVKNISRIFDPVVLYFDKNY